MCNNYMCYVEYIHEATWVCLMFREFKGTETYGDAIIEKGIPLKTSACV